MNFGKLNKRVNIQSSELVRDPAGQSLPQWTTDDEVWAKISPATGRELYAGEQVKAEVTHTVLIRYYDGLTTKHRIEFGSRIFDINFIKDIDERNRYMQLLCKEVQ